MLTVGGAWCREGGRIVGAAETVVICSGDTCSGTRLFCGGKSAWLTETLTGNSPIRADSPTCRLKRDVTDLLGEMDAYLISSGSPIALISGLPVSNFTTTPSALRSP